MSEDFITIVPTVDQLDALKAHHLTVRHCIALKPSPSTIFGYHFRDNDVRCFTIDVFGAVEIEKREFDPRSGWTKEAGTLTRCFICEEPTDELVEVQHDGDTAMFCAECAA